MLDNVCVLAGLLAGQSTRPARPILSKGQAKISSMNKLNRVSDLISNIIENTECAALSMLVHHLPAHYL